MVWDFQVVQKRAEELEILRLFGGENLLLTRYFWIAGSRSPIKTPAVEIITSSSISVNPAIWRMVLSFFFIVIAPFIFNLFKIRRDRFRRSAAILTAVEITPPTKKAEVFDKNYHFFLEVKFFFGAAIIKAIGARPSAVLGQSGRQTKF